MPIYSVFGITILSEISLPELFEVDEEPDVIIRVDKLNRLERIHNSGSVFRGQISGLLRFVVDRGQEIVIELSSKTDLSLIQLAIYGPILSILLRQRGFLVLHGSCVAIEGSSIAFIGSSRAGKSTLAEAFFQRDYSVITDDILAIRSDFANPLVVPSIPRVKLWSDSALAMGYNIEELPRISNRCPKYFHIFESLKRNISPLSSIYILDQGIDVSIKRLSCRGAFLKLLQYSRATALTHPYYIKSHFELCTSLLCSVPVYSLQRPFDYELLPDVVNKILNHEWQTQQLLETV